MTGMEGKLWMAQALSPTDPFHFTSAVAASCFVKNFKLKDYLKKPTTGNLINNHTLAELFVRLARGGSFLLQRVKQH